MISDMLQAASDSQLPEKKRSIGCGGWEDMSKRKEISTKKKKVELELSLKGGEDLKKWGGHPKLWEQHEQRYRDRNT